MIRRTTVAACGGACLIFALIAAVAGAEPWLSDPFLLTRKHLREISPDAQIIVDDVTDRKRFFLSSDGNLLCQVNMREHGSPGLALRGKGRQSLWKIENLPGYCGGAFVCRSGAVIAVDGYGRIDRYHAYGATFIAAGGKDIEQVRPAGGVCSVALSRDEKAFLMCGPSSREDRNHTNRIALYDTSGTRIWDVDIGKLDQVGECAVSSDAVFVTTRAPDARILCFSMQDGKPLFDRNIENEGAKGVCFYRYLILSDDESTLLGLGWGDLVAIDAKTGRTMWHQNLYALSGNEFPRGINGARFYTVACSTDGSRVAVLAASVGRVSGTRSDVPAVCRHYALLYDRNGALTSVRDLETVTDYYDLEWHYLMFPRFEGGLLYVKDDVNEVLVAMELTGEGRVRKMSLTGNEAKQERAAYEGKEREFHGTPWRLP